MRSSTVILSFLLLLLLIPPPCSEHILASAAEGKWDLLLSNIGVSAMHMQLLYTDRVVIFDRTDFGRSNISLPDGKCRYDANDTALKVDCSAHSVEYDVASNSIRPLMVLTDVWCSSAAVTSDGTLVQTGGFNDGDHAVRIYKPCRDNSCDWEETPNGLSKRRWYATNHILPDGREIIVGGRRQFNFEFYPKKSASESSYNLPFLVQTNDQGIENNLYPFVFLNEDGNLFIFANYLAILFDYRNMKVVKNYPPIPGGDPRNYPSSGSAVLLPLKNNTPAEVLVCGGAPKGGYINAVNGNFSNALDTCGRIRINDPNPQWAMEVMPMGRVMGDMVLLPNGNVLIINGASRGTAGWEFGRDPVLSPVVYKLSNWNISRFEAQHPSSTPRMYHSTAILLRDGRILVGGSNSHKYYNFTGVMFPTDLSLESFSPFYLDSKFVNSRPKIIAPISGTKLGYGQQIDLQFTILQNMTNGGLVMVTMVSPSFTTHSFSMNQRLLILTGGNVSVIGESMYGIRVVTPNSGYMAPAGFYLLFVVQRDIPSEGIWVQIM